MPDGTDPALSMDHNRPALDTPDAQYEGAIGGDTCAREGHPNAGGLPGGLNAALASVNGV